MKKPQRGQRGQGIRVALGSFCCEALFVSGPWSVVRGPWSAVASLLAPAALMKEK